MTCGIDDDNVIIEEMKRQVKQAVDEITRKVKQYYFILLIKRDFLNLFYLTSGDYLIRVREYVLSEHLMLICLCNN